MPSRPSCFFFVAWSLLLTIYVDDLMLSGPEEHHDNFWRTLEKEVTSEPEEDPTMYLGRYHTFTEKERLPYIRFEFFKSNVV